MANKIFKIGDIPNGSLIKVEVFQSVRAKGFKTNQRTKLSEHVIVHRTSANGYYCSVGGNPSKTLYMTPNAQLVKVNDHYEVIRKGNS